MLASVRLVRFGLVFNGGRDNLTPGGELAPLMGPVQPGRSCVVLVSCLQS